MEKAKPQNSGAPPGAESPDVGYSSVSEIYKRIYNSPDVPSAESIVRALEISKGVCGKHLGHHQTAWSCPVCGKESNSIICEECYIESLHVGHKAVRVKVIGGTCDCGDPDVWDKKGACPKHAGGFEDETQVTANQLPESMRQSAPATLDRVIAHLNACCLQLDGMYQNSGTKGANAEKLHEVLMLQEDVALIVEALGHLVGVSHVFLHMIAIRLRDYSARNVTKHACNVRRFDSEAEEERFYVLCTGKNIDFEMCRISGSEHPCTCTVIENLMKAMTGFNPEDQERFVQHLFTPMLANRRLKYYMALGYFSNYQYIVPKSMPLMTLSVQFLGYEDVNQSVLGSDEYLRLILGQFDRVIANLPEYVRSRNEVKYEVSSMVSDVILLMRQKYLKLYLPFLLDYIKRLVAFLPLEAYPRGLKDPYQLALVVDIGVDFEAAFLHMISALDLNNLEMCRPVGLAFKEAIIADSKRPLDNNVGTFSLTMHRCLATFLTNYLLVRYWTSPMPDPAKFKDELAALFGFNSEAEQETFAEECVKRILRFVGFTVEVHAGVWQSQGVPAHNRKPSDRGEYCLAAILVPLLNMKNLFQWIFKSMHADWENMWGCLEAICTNRRPDAYFDPAGDKRRSKENIQQMIEDTLYSLCCLTSNDTMYLSPLSIFRKRREAQKLPLDKIKGIANEYAEYAISKQIVATYLQKADHSGVKNTDIAEGLSESVRDVNKIERCLEGISKPFMDKINRVVKFKLLDEALKLYDPFSYYLKILFNEEVERSTEIMKRIRDPSKYDHFFAELAHDEHPMDLLSSGAPMVPFKVLLRRHLAQTDIVPLVLKIVENPDVDFVTPWMLRCCYKLLLAFAPYSKDDLLIRKTLARHMAKFAFEEDWKDIVEKYRQIIYPVAASLTAGPSEEVKLTEESPCAVRALTKEEREKASQLRFKTLEEFKQRVVAFQNKNRTILSETKYVDPEKVSFVCGYCREPVAVSSFDKEPYGKVIYIHQSKLYGHYLNQVLKKVKRKAWRKDYQFGCVPGLTHGLVLTSCGHYLHEKCWRHILEKPPNNPVSNIDTEYERKTFLCPLCKMCGNNLLTPYDVVEQGSAAGIKQVKEGLMSEMRIARDCFMSEESVQDERFKLICNYITYQFQLVDLTSIADYSIKEDCIHSLVYCLKSLVAPDLYNEMMAIKEDISSALSFLHKDTQSLFGVDLLSVFTQLIVAAKLIDCKERADTICSELVDKLHKIVKLAVIQIVLGIVCANLKGEVTQEKLADALKEPALETLITGSQKRIEKRLLPFLKKLLCMKLVLFPTPGHDVKTDIAKVGWLSETHGVDFYLTELSLNKDIVTSVLAPAKADTKEAFLKLPYIDRNWTLACFSGLVRSFSPNTKDLWPMLSTYKAGRKKFSLIPLADTFDQLQAAYVDTPCKECKRVVRDSAVCLLCGELLCVAKACCIKQDKGELSYHATVCQAGSGMFLRLYNNRVILVDGGQACTYPSPYVNKYGESVDISKSHEKEKLTREDRIVEELKGFYLSHSIPQTTRVISLRSFVKFKPFSL